MMTFSILLCPKGWLYKMVPIADRKSVFLICPSTYLSFFLLITGYAGFSLWCSAKDFISRANFFFIAHPKLAKMWGTIG